MTKRGVPGRRGLPRGRGGERGGAMMGVSVVARWVGALAVAAIAGSCGQAGAPGDTTTVRSAVNSNVLVTVRDGAGVLQPGVQVFAVKTNGSIPTSAFTNGSGVATLSLAANSYRFKVDEAGSDFFSGAAGHCTTPSCTTAQITVTRVDVTVVLTDGTPLANRSVWWETPGGQTGGYVYSDANGHSLVAVPAGSYAFFNEVNGWEFPSGSAGHCVVPTCTTATIVETVPVAVTVRNASGVPQANVSVAWEDGNGVVGGWNPTDANGLVMMSVPQGAITFKVDVPPDIEFDSATCQVPGCTSASITMSSPVTVTVTDTGGAPITGKDVHWENAAGDLGGGINTNASGVAIVTPPLEPVRFKVILDGVYFYSATTTNCTQPGCTSATILVSQQSIVTVVDGSGNPISGRAVTPVSTEGLTSGNKTTNASGQATFRLPFAHWQFKAKCSGNNETFFSGSAGHCFIPGGCVTAKIKLPCGQCTTAANGTACDDQSPCTGSSTCQSHFCTGSNPMSCSAADQCHDAGACGVETGACSNPAKANGTSCSDSNACTQTDTCQSGTCTAGTSVTCTAADQCHDAGTCNPATGTCSNPAKMNGTSCSDGNSCTSSDTCQAGSCTAGPNTCATIAVTETVAGNFPQPKLAATLDLDATGYVPGDPMTITSTVTNAGLVLGISGDFTIDNTGSSTFVVGAFQQTLEYQAVPSGVWTPFARVAYDASGNVVPETTLVQLTLDVFTLPGSHGITFNIGNGTIATGMSIAAGGEAHLGWGMNPLIPPDVVEIIFDPAQSAGLRARVSFDIPSGTPQASAASLSYPGETGIATDIAAGAFVSGANFFQSVPLTATETGPLDPGATRAFSATITAPMPGSLARGTNESEAEYIARLRFDQVARYSTSASVTGQGVAYPAIPVSPVGPQPAMTLPIVVPAKSGPATIAAGFSGTFSLSLPNSGTAMANALVIADSVDGQPVTTSNVSLSPNVAPAETGAGSFTAQVPLARPAGAMTDVVTLTWQDRNGNGYGPVSASFTNGVTAGHPEGYLTLTTATTDIPDLVGSTKTFTVTARDPFGNPAPGVTIHFVVTGVHAQTPDVITAADGSATFSYAGTVIGQDTVVASATITTTTVTSPPIGVNWASGVGTPCTGRATPLDIILVVDVSGSMVLEPGGGSSAGKLEAAQAAAFRFMDNLNPARDQVGLVAFRGGVDQFVPLSFDSNNVKPNLASAVDGGIFCATNSCSPFGTGSNLDVAVNAALDELESSRHRPDATKVVVYIGDGGIGNDPAVAIARLHTSGTKSVTIAIGSFVDGAVGRQVASSPNDYFYAPSGAGVDFAFNNLNQDLCRNLAPFVSAGGDQGVYNVRIPASLTLQGEVHDDGAGNDPRLTAEWTVISGPGPVAFNDASSPITDALFGLPGTYVLQLAGSDGYLTVADRATVTVDPDPSIVGANLAVALTAPGPLETGQTETLTATLTDSLGVPIRDYAVRVTVAGANPVTTTLITNVAGVATFAYQGAKAGTDALHATALGSSFSLDSSFITVDWVQPASGGAFLVQGWIGAPLDQAKVMERIPVTLSPDVTLTNGTLIYFPASTPTDVHVVATNLSGQPGATLATFDTTMLSNGSYVLQLDGTNQAGNQKTSVVLLTVTGEYKPGRVVVELNDLTVPIAGLPITIGRRYDSLDKDKVGDFGYGWSLMIGHPRLEVNPNFGVSLTLPNGRRATFDLLLTPQTDEFNVNVFAGFFGPSYKGEPGVYGSLTQQGGCPIVRYNPANPASPLTCLLLGTLPYAPDSFTYTDPYGTAYKMAASGELKSITDRQGNTLSFEPNGIISSTGKSVSFVRDAQGRITKVDYPAFFGPDVDAVQYTYDANGDLTTADLAKVPNLYFRTTHHTYDQHRLLTSTDPNGNTARTSTYDANGRLATDKDALNNETTYAYDVDARTTTTTYPDTGVVAQVFDAQGLVLSETDQLGHTTTHEYDANRNETKRTNALAEVTSATYDDHGNQTSVTDPIGTTHTTYNDQNLPTTFKDRLGHVTTIGYDDRQVPSSFADELGTRFTFTNSEQGLPLTVDDAAGKRAYIDYDAAGNVTARTDWLGRVTRTSYDDGGYRKSETTARGGVTQYRYLQDGKLESTIDPLGRVHGFARDANGNVLREDETARNIFHTYNALNQLLVTHYSQADTFVSYTRDFRGNPLTMTDENAHTTGYQYDKKGNLTKTTYADGKFTTRTYDELDRLASATDERGNTTTYEYDEGCGCSDRVTKVTDPLGHATVTAYDANGRRSSVTDANGHTTSFVYDVRGHVIETDFPDGTSTHEGYDARGRRISMTDQMGKTTFYGYDDQGQLTSVTDPLTNVTHYAYDLDGDLTSVTDANGHTTTYEYDLRKEKTKRTLPLGQFETFAYDLYTNQISHADFRGKTTTMTYDSRDRMLTKVPDPSLGEASHSYTYSPTGMRLSSTDGSGATTYSYDLRDRMLTKAATAGTLTYTYDRAGNLASLRSSNTNGTSIDYAWDGANQLASVTDNRDGGTTTAAYTPTNRPSTLAQPNGIALTYSYDALDRVASMLWQRGSAAPFGSWSYTHNDRGQRLSSTDITGRVETYTYDPTSRLATETIAGDPRGTSVNGALSYALDGAGNRLSRTSTLAALSAQSFTYNANDEISGDTFDANGNTLSSDGHTFVYDFENRLVSKDGGSVTVAYDCEGNRVAKTVGGVTTRYLVDDLNPTGYLQVLEEVVGGAVQTRYTYGTNLASRTRNVSGTPATNFYGFDDHGNITFLTDATGAVTDSYDYDAWGDLVASTGSTPNSRLYTGEEFDPDLGVINLRARQYKARTGRFLAIDLLSGRSEEPTSLNRYLYAAADPSNRIDPLGLEGEEYGVLARGVTGTLQSRTAIALGAAAKTTTDVVMAAVAAYATVCTFYIIGTALDSYVFHSQMAIFNPPPPFQLCAIRGPRDRGTTGKPSGTPNPCKHMRPHPTDPTKVIFRDPSSGKKIIKPKPPGFPDDC